MNEPLRPGPIVGIARRDLQMMLSGRRGAILPALLIGTLAPMAWFTLEKIPPRVSGDVPDAVRAIPGARVVEKGGTRFTASTDPEDPQLVLRGSPPLPAVREALTTPDDLAVIEPTRPLQPPGRTLLMPLMAATLLTGALSESVPGERSQRTLSELLTAAVGRMEIIAGKVLAWGGLASVAALLASVVYALRGGMELGPWILAVGVFPIANAAIAVWLVRGAADVVGAASVALRLLPLGIGASAAVAWVLALQAPWLGAAFPVGGVLVAAGGTFESWPVVLLACASTGALIGWLVRDTARALDAETDRGPSPLDPLSWMAGAGLVGFSAWLGVVGPVFWRAAGRETLLGGQSVPATAWSPATVMVAWLALLLMRGDIRFDEMIRARWSVSEVARLLGVGVLLGSAAPAGAVLPLPESALLAEMRVASGPTLDPTWLPWTFAVPTLVAHEWFFRRWLQDRLGVVGQATVWWLAFSPLDPVRGLGTGLVLGGLAAGGGPLAAVAARVLGAVIADPLGVLDPAPAAACLLLAVLVAMIRR